MQAKLVAAKLTKAGITVLDYSEGNDYEDGTVSITQMIHIQVPVYGNAPSVVAEYCDDTFEFYPQRTSLKALLLDLRKAMGLVSVL